jgi:hypothetical protein
VGGCVRLRGFGRYGATRLNGGSVIIYAGKDLARSFRDVRGNTITVAEDKPKEKDTFQQERMAQPRR